jgi:triosephosphate isomerase
LAVLERRRIFVNFKTYEHGSGRKSGILAEKLARVSRGRAVLIVQNTDLYRVSRAVGIPVFAQHMDAVGQGQFTGHDTALTLKENGASGVLINHSEDRKNLSEIKSCILLCRKAKMKSLVCAARSSDVAKIAALRPDMIAIEPPELIGTGIAVSRANPQIVIRSVKAIRKTSKKTIVLCGAGISAAEDVKKAIELGCDGVLLASAVMKAKKPEKVLSEFVNALPKM